jgi:hypothetical protein
MRADTNIGLCVVLRMSDYKKLLAAYRWITRHRAELRICGFTAARLGEPVFDKALDTLGKKVGAAKLATVCTVLYCVLIWRKSYECPST